MSSRVRRNSFLLSIAFLALSGRSNVTKRSEVTGKYLAPPPGNVEILELHPDGTYTVRLKGADGPESSYSDRWNFEPYEGDPKISLQNFPDTFPKIRTARRLALPSWGLSVIGAKFYFTGITTEASIIPKMQRSECHKRGPCRNCHVHSYSPLSGCRSPERSQCD